MAHRSGSVNYLLELNFQGENWIGFLWVWVHPGVGVGSGVACDLELGWKGLVPQRKSRGDHSHGHPVGSKQLPGQRRHLAQRRRRGPETRKAE